MIRANRFARIELRIACATKARNLENPNLLGGFSSVILAFGVIPLFLPLEKWNLRGLASLFKEVTVFKERAAKGAKWVMVKQPKNRRKSRTTAVLTVFPVLFRLFYRHFARDPLGTFFWLFLISGIWHLTVDGRRDCKHSLSGGVLERVPSSSGC